MDLLTGIYTRALPALKEGLENHLRDTTVGRLAVRPGAPLRPAGNRYDLLAWGRQALECLADEPRTEDLDGWLALLDDCLAAAGGLDGASTTTGLGATPRFSEMPFRYDRTPRRDARFPDPYNMGVHAEEFLYTPGFPASAKTLMMYYKRLREIDVPEMMASILVESPDKPWEFHRDLTRQLWTRPATRSWAKPASSSWVSTGRNA